MAKLLYDLKGALGRRMKMYDTKVEIETVATAGSFMTGNLTDGKKTIFYEDVVGVQYCPQPLNLVTVGYLQFETASAQMNQSGSNQFSENTFTYKHDSNGITDRMMEKIYNEVCNLIETVKHQRNAEPASSSTLIQTVIDQKLEKIEPALNINPNASEESLITRINMFIEDEKWEYASSYANYVLDMNPTNGYVYYLMLLIDRKVKTDEELFSLGQSIQENPNLKYIERYGSPELVNKILKIDSNISDNLQQIEANNAIYEQGISLMNKNQAVYLEKAIEKFALIKGWRDSQEQIRKCEDKIKQIPYSEAYELMRKGDIQSLAEAVILFNQYPDYRDSREMIKSCRKRIQDIKTDTIDSVKVQIESIDAEEVNKGINELVKLYDLNNKYNLFNDDLISLIKKGKSNLIAIKMKPKQQ